MYFVLATPRVPVGNNTMGFVENSVTINTPTGPGSGITFVLANFVMSNFVQPNINRSTIYQTLGYGNYWQEPQTVPTSSSISLGGQFYYTNGADYTTFTLEPVRNGGFYSVFLIGKEGSKKIAVIEELSIFIAIPTSAPPSSPDKTTRPTHTTVEPSRNNQGFSKLAFWLVTGILGGCLFLTCFGIVVGLACVMCLPKYRYQPVQ